MSSKWLIILIGHCDRALEQGHGRLGRQDLQFIPAITLPPRDVGAKPTKQTDPRLPLTLRHSNRQISNAHCAEDCSRCYVGTSSARRLTARAVLPAFWAEGDRPAGSSNTQFTSCSHPQQLVCRSPWLARQLP
jgi:hypothetical protein